MKPERFVAANAAEAMKMTKRKLGSDAMVLSTRETSEGVEIVAISAEDLGKLSAETQRSAISVNDLAHIPASQPMPASVKRSETGQYQVGPHQLKIADVMNKPRGPDNSPVIPPDAPKKAAASASGKGLPSAAGIPDSPQVDKLFAEVSEVKSLLQTHLAGNFWNALQQQSPTHAEVTKNLLNAGFSPRLCAEMVQALPQEGTVQELMDHAQKIFEGMIPTIDPMETFDEGGVFGFIGPTGVGKTTTVAKVAARCVLRYGRNQVALLTTDTYRIGAQEQLKVFAKILGLPVVSVRDSDDLAAKIAEASQRKVVLLDTAGVSQRDTLMIDQSTLLREGSKGAKRILVMSSTTDLRTQEDVIMMHNRADSEKAIRACILTKTDEAAHLAPALDCLIRYELPLLFLSNGQRVPEDLNPSNTSYLAYRAMHPRMLGSEMEYDHQQVPALIADNLTDWSVKTKR